MITWKYSAIVWLYCLQSTTIEAINYSINSLRPSDAYMRQQTNHHWADIGLSPGRRQAIVSTNAEILLIGHLGINFGEILIKIDAFSFTKMHLKISLEHGGHLSRPQCVSWCGTNGSCSISMYHRAYESNINLWMLSGLKTVRINKFYFPCIHKRTMSRMENKHLTFVGHHWFWWGLTCC